MEARRTRREPGFSAAHTHGSGGHSREEADLRASGSVAPRFNYCGKPNCRRHGDPPQPLGPYFQWTAKVSGKTVNRRQSAREAELYEEWIGNDRRLRALIEELRQVAEEATNLILETEARVSF
jgi:hypothetical protein